MRVPTITVRHTDGRTMVVNESDYALGSIPGVHIGSDWTRISETHGDANVDEAVKAAKDQRNMVEAQALKAPALEAKK